MKVYEVHVTSPFRIFANLEEVEATFGVPGLLQELQKAVGNVGEVKLDMKNGFHLDLFIREKEVHGEPEP